MQWGTLIPAIRDNVKDLERNATKLKLIWKQLQQRMISVLAARFYSNILAGPSFQFRQHVPPAANSTKSLRKARTEIGIRRSPQKIIQEFVA